MATIDVVFPQYAEDEVDTKSPLIAATFIRNADAGQFSNGGNYLAGLD